MGVEGFYVVVSVPICGVQCTVKYNIITEDIIVIFRAPLPDGNDDDKKGAAACGASLVYLNFEFDYHIVREKVYAYESIKHYVYNSPQTLPPISHSNTVTSPQSNVISDVVEGTGNAIAGAVEGIGNLLGSWFKPKRTNKNERLVYN
uniref:Uncharacterized protein n=1 Tax=Panagrolaimus davidi TaxID=227884 RepID=A0A914PLJ1_9BILA